MGRPGSHKNKYEHLAPRDKAYKQEDKSRRFLRVTGKPGRVIPKGSIIPYHGRMYRTEDDVTIPDKRRFGRKARVFVWCRLERMLPGESL